ncbi:MAG: hypothetical protein RIQ60_1350 [Pseudomonadota bacterium]|jgi:glycosyltransferase involved in cell wall biosynthesis
MSLSVILITLNEQANLADCLASVAFADEIVVVDQDSSDGTREIAAAHGARVQVHADWPGFGAQKNRALDLARSDWVLSLDADERITPALRDEILAVMDDPSAAACYSMPRSSWYCGRFMKHSGWTPDRVVRLFRRGTARFSNDLVHERLVFEGRAGALREPMLHYSYRDFSRVLHKIDQYSSASALQKFQAGQRASVGQALWHGVWAFVRTYVLRRGFLDGAHGLALAISNAETSYYRYLKLWALQQQASAGADMAGEGAAAKPEPARAPGPDALGR